MITVVTDVVREFQSTRPVRGATQSSGRSARATKFQSTRPVRGATEAGKAAERHEGVSIHAPRAGRDSYNARLSKFHHRFQSTRPVRGATTIRSLVTNTTIVSIHAPRAGRDPQIRFSIISPMQFQSTRPVRGATCVACNLDIGGRVSIHAPRAGRDARACRGWGRRKVSIHAPRAGRDATQQRRFIAAPRFNPRAPCGARRQMRLRLPSFATYLWVLRAINMIFSAFCPTPLLRHGSHTYIFTPYFLFTSPSHSGRMLR